MKDLSGSIWKLVEVTAHDAEGREMESPIPHPLGITMFGQNRILAAVTDTRSPKPPGAPPQVFFSYTGTYRFDGTTLFTKTDDASKPDMLTDHVRDMRFETPTRLIVTSKTDLLGRAGGLTFVWERLE
jgi:hypothetical protein